MKIWDLLGRDLMRQMSTGAACPGADFYAGATIGDTLQQRFLLSIPLSRRVPIWFSTWVKGNFLMSGTQTRILFQSRWSLLTTHFLPLLGDNSSSKLQFLKYCLMFWLSFDSQRAPLQDLNSYLEFMETIVKAKPEAKVETIFKMNFLKYNLFFDFAGFLS